VITKEKDIVDIPENIDTTKFTEKDYDDMSFEELIKYDKRSFLRKAFIQIKNDNVLASLIFKRSLIYPLHLAFFCFFFDFFIDCGANAIFYSDEYITKIYENQNKVIFFLIHPYSNSYILFLRFVLFYLFLKLKSFITLFFWSLPKSLYAGLFVVLLGSFIRLFIEPPTITKKEISVVCINKNIAEIRYS